MELKTDKIHRILNTPYDELSPQDFAVAQEQLDVLVVGTRDKQIDAFQFIENKLVCERDEALKRVSQLTDQLAAQQEKPIALELMARIADLKRVAQTDAEAIANLIKERDRLIFERDAIKAELEQSKTQAANASAMVVSIATERDAAQQRELKALRQLADLVERTSKPTIFEYPAPGSAGRNVGSASEFAKLADEEVAAAHEALDKREAELDKHGYGRAPGTPPAKVVGLYDHQCAMPTPDGPCTARPTGRNNGFPFCSRHLDAIRDGMRREHEQAAMSRVNAAIAAGKADPLAASIDGGQTWWCPQCQSSIIPDVPHVCPEPFDAFAKLSPEERALIRSLPDEQPE